MMAAASWVSAHGVPQTTTATVIPAAALSITSTESFAARARN
jgi:hypothetical protein